MTIAEKRKELGRLLKEVTGIENIYFEPPSSITLKYPCLIYKRESGDPRYADNKLYRFMVRYQLMHIKKNPDDTLVEELPMRLKNCRYDRTYDADTLNHDVYTLYY